MLRMTPALVIKFGFGCRKSHGPSRRLVMYRTCAKLVIISLNRSAEALETLMLMSLAKPRQATMYLLDELIAV
jgi:hypothetical protein